MLILTILGYYLILGGLFGAAFFIRGHAAIAPEARGAPMSVRLLWTPAAVVLWPLLAWKWLRRRPAVPQAPHSSNHPSP